MTAADWLNLLLVLVTMLGLIIQHFWIRRRDERRDRRDFYFRAVEQPCQSLLEQFSSLETDVYMWSRALAGVSAEQVQAKAIFVNRQYNRLINSLAELDQTDTKIWLKVSAASLDEVVEDLSDERRRLGSNALETEIQTIERRIREAVRSDRPK